MHHNVFDKIFTNHGWCEKALLYIGQICNKYNPLVTIGRNQYVKFMTCQNV